MFSEVYWHHAVRAATAMLQRAVWLTRQSAAPETLMRMDDAEFAAWIVGESRGGPAARLVDGLFGPTRQLLKRAATFDAVHHPRIHSLFAGREYSEMVLLSGRLADSLSRHLGIEIPPAMLLIDAPPAAKEVEFRLQVRERSGHAADPPHRWRPLADVSPVVRSLAHEQFDSLVKRVRVFAPAPVASAIAACSDFESLMLDLAGQAGGFPS
jgi:HD superfamily phosphohydrolase